MAIPGIDRNDYTIEFEGDCYTISAEKEEKKEGTSNCSRRKEFSNNSFSRSLRLTVNHEEDKIKAEYVNGILKVEIL